MGLDEFNSYTCFNSYAGNFLNTEVRRKSIQSVHNIPAEDLIRIIVVGAAHVVGVVFSIANSPAPSG